MSIRIEMNISLPEQKPLQAFFSNRAGLFRWESWEPFISHQDSTQSLLWHGLSFRIIRSPADSPQLPRNIHSDWRISVVLPFALRLPWLQTWYQLPVRQTFIQQKDARLFTGHQHTKGGMKKLLLCKSYCNLRANLKTSKTVRKTEISFVNKTVRLRKKLQPWNYCTANHRSISIQTVCLSFRAKRNRRHKTAALLP